MEPSLEYARRVVWTFGYLPIFYTLGRTTTCLLLDGEHLVARGVAICSTLDQFDTTRGRDWAFRRAALAILTKKPWDLEVVPRRIHRIRQGQIVSHGAHLDVAIAYKAYYEPSIITPTEQGLIRKKLASRKEAVDRSNSRTT